jgi:hypothetical protein
MQKQADDGGSEFGGVRVNSRLIPLVGPVHHAEEAEDRDTGMDAGGEALRSDRIKDFAGEGVIAALNGLNFVVVRVTERIFLVGKDLHFVGMGEEVFDVVEDEEAEALSGLVDALEPRPDAFENKRKGCTLNEIEEMLLVFKIIVEASEGDTGGAADIAHGGALKAMLSKDLRGGAKDVLELGFGIAGNRSGGSHRHLERSFDKCSSSH